MPSTSPTAVAQFIERWEKSGGSEMANYALFLTELCDQILQVPHPEPSGTDTEQNRYAFERGVTHKAADGSSSSGRIDLYKAGCFVLETKQGTFAKAKEGGTVLDFAPSASPQKTGHGKRGTASFDKVIQRAYNQARKYITALPASDGRPPFLIVCDVGHSIDLYAEFSGTGGQYERFPDPVSHRIQLADLQRPEIRERLRQVWTDPHALDPSKYAAAVTRKVAKALAELAKSLEIDGHEPMVAAGFLQRCLFTMFAEDVELLPKNSFLQLLEKVRASPAGFPVMLSALWQDMATGSDFSTVLLGAVPHFNGGLFEDTTALPLRPDQIELLIHAAKTDWSAVEPAIFGTLVERALDPRERHKLGAHYTPRSYVERLVRPALIDPLRGEWESVKAAASLASDKARQAETAASAIATDAQQHIQALDKTKAEASNKRHADTLKQAAAHREEALAAVRDFHRKLCHLRVLDPACGTGNFLYVCLELMKRLEAEVLEAYESLGGDAGFEMTSFKIGPRQFLGLELNGRAVAIAQLVLWIGFFQWQRKTTGKADTHERPLLPKAASILQQDAVLAYDAATPRIDPQTGETVTIWDGQSTKPHPITGKEVPDDSARKVVFDYSNPRRAEWPAADVIVGNPPFIGKGERMRDLLGDGYVEGLRKAWKGLVPDSADFVMFWWEKAAELVRDGKTQSFGLITTNSIHQTFNRRVIEPFLADEKKPLHLSYAIADHPWVDSADGAAVRIAMTVAERGKAKGVLEKVVAETVREDGENDVVLLRSGGTLAPNLQIGADVTSCVGLASNANISSMGMMIRGGGFILNQDTAKDLQNGITGDSIIKPYVNGRDLLQTSRTAMIIDAYGLEEAELAERYPTIYQHLLVHVKPERDASRDKQFKELWWLFGRWRPQFRGFSAEVPRYLATVETAKHRLFIFLDSEVIPDHGLIVFGLDDSFQVAILSSRLHTIWALLQGGTLEDRPRYNKSRCFETFPFPEVEEGPLKQRVRDLGERLDAHRKTQQAQHPELTLTGLYNVLDAVRQGTPLSAKEKAIHDAGLVSILKQIHDELDAAVLEAYGWVGEFGMTHGECGREEAMADVLARGGAAAEALEQDLLTRLVALNHARAAEEQRGLVRWLRPDYQNPTGHAAAAEATQSLPGTEAIAAPKPRAAETAASIWPDGIPAQFTAVQKLIASHGADAEAIAASFGKKSAKRSQQVAEILETLRGLGTLNTER